ncbi:PREDICTED: zinc finger CCCH domain-containing protein 7A isoform X1 [Crocodylus porosus]|uniref:zinc finger CCCH domain-containing protein 7A isoform X1 n=1 Tax=Crocodylus porosus TaxID=8502 RepID=UPI000939BE8B|nr:PREDICTED: zinc finger CCCH domain-containing protein 7A isoform X1 [Crocodylus porosus]XP_019395671.1 PREDICTED: zinc finger CCCH domain-containing protein 7A isoform X1 [Crocodylus porosus]
MSNVLEDRSIRQQDIKKGLQFIQSTLPYPGTQEQYELFIRELVRNLFNEGNDVYRERDWGGSLSHYTEAINVADYANSEDIHIPSEILEKLHVNRIACFSNMGLYEKVLEDCEIALRLNDNNFRALYRKAKALNELGRYKKAYDAVAKCSLAVPQDESVIKLTQELAQKLGLKIRKAYVRAKPPSSHSVSGELSIKNSNSPIEDIESDLSERKQETLSSVSSSASNFSPEVSNDLISVSVPSISSVMSLQVEKSSLPSSVLANGGNVSFSMPEACLDCGDGDIIIGEELDELLDLVPHPDESVMQTTVVRGSIPTASVAPKIPFSTPLLGALQVGAGFVATASFSEMYSQPLASSLENFCSTLNNFSINDTKRDLSSSVSRDGAPALSSSSSLFQINGPNSLFGSENYMGIVGQNRNDFSNIFSSAPANIPISSSVIGRNPLEGTHDLRQACQLCFIKTGPKLLDYTYHPNLEHKCKKDILIGRIKNSEDKSWKKIRPRPTKTQYVGPYYICKDVAAEEECRYPGHCTFAYCQEEIDVWTLERKGAFSREALFGGNAEITFTVSQLLQEHHGLFMFLCEKCFDHKPRIISKRNKDNSSSCSHPAMHDFEDNKCLVHILRETTVKYSKIRPFHVQCQLDLCRHEVRYGCLREDECFYAHSLVELKVWIMQNEKGISHDTVVQESKKYWQNMEANAHGSQVLGNQVKHGSLNLKMKFVCAQCWRNGQVSEPDKNRKYCSAKARHPWTKDRRVVLVMSNERKKWMTIRPLPTKKQVPLQFDLCNHIASGKKCQYVGNCSFAHSPEEREMWTYMKENGIQDMEQLYDIWLKNQKPEKGDDTAPQANKENGKQIHMPTDYAEVTVDFHCWMCGKNCNSEKQWQGHISSEKHKEKVFHTEDDQNCWQYRFPTGFFSICDRYTAGACTEGNNCKFAHGNAELREWEERRDVLRMKLRKARKDHLIAPNDNDFGKYSFLFKDLN